MNTAVLRSSLVMVACLTAASGSVEAVEVPCPPYYNSNTEWWLYQFDGYDQDPFHSLFSNHNCGPACTAMVINYFKKKGITTSYQPVISPDHANVHCHARWDYCEANGVPGGYADSDWSEPGATYGQIQSVLSSEGIESHALTGSACENDGTGIANVKGAIDEGKICICKVAPMYYRDVGYFSHWTVVYGYDGSSIYLNDPGYSAPPSGQGFQAEVSRFADAMWKLSELQVIVVVDTVLTAVRTWYVDGGVTQSGDGKSWATAFKRIQEGIDAAGNGNTVIVGEGTYVENIHFKGKNITLRSTDPLDLDVVENTIIDANQAGSVVTFTGTENETCVLSGFTIRNGRAEVHGGGILGGTWENQAHATVENSVITANYLDALKWCDGAIRNNAITDNPSFSLSYCHGTIQNNTISGNGGGPSLCGGAIRNNVIAGNAGYGLWDCDGAIQNNIIARNGEDGLIFCDGTIENNTIAGNGEAGLCYCHGTIRNCIVWGNHAPGEVFESTCPTYSCVQGWRGGGQGNIFSYAYFVDLASGDYHLQPWSACVDTGDPLSPFSQEPYPNGYRINMGAYGNTPEAASKSADDDRDGLPDDWEREVFGSLRYGADADPDGDSLANVEEYCRGYDPAASPSSWFVDESVTESGDGKSWVGAFKGIQEAMNVACAGDSIMVGEGTYYENVYFGGKDIVLTSKDPRSLAVVKATIIDGKNEGPAAAFDGSEDETCVLTGFTIRNGYGGIFGSGAHATIRQNIIMWNGGGVDSCDGVIENNVISQNEIYEGGGLAYCNGTIRGNLITGNLALWDDGGGIAYCDGLIVNNTIVGNRAVGSGGGLYFCGGAVRNCIIWGNDATVCAQMLIDPNMHVDAVVQNCCVQGWTGGGTNIGVDPSFALGGYWDDNGTPDDWWDDSWIEGNYRLRPQSPCIDTGKNQDWMSDAVDVDGNPRVFYGGHSLTVDMGAYEYGSWPFKVVDVIDTGVGGGLLMWNSRSTDTYTVWSCADLSSGTWVQEATISSKGDLSSWTDPAPLGQAKFYRVELK